MARMPSDPVCTSFFLTWTFAECRVFHYPLPCYTETVFADGTLVKAAPQDNEAYRATAERLGYGADTCRMSRDHELLHSWLSIRQGKQYSPTLWALAHDEPADLPAHLQEETLVCAFAAYLNGVGVAWHPQWEVWAEEARETLQSGV